MDEVRDLHHVILAEAAGSHSRRANADAAGFHDRLGIERNRVFVHRDRGLVEHHRGFRSRYSRRAEVNEEDMIVRAAGDDAVAEF